MSLLKSILTGAGGVVIVVAIMTLTLLHFMRLEALYQASNPAEKNAIEKKYKKRMRWCFITMFFGMVFIIISVRGLHN